MRGTFANIRIKNEMLDGVEGGFTKGPDGQQTTIFDASMAYQDAGTPLVSDPGYVVARAAVAEGLPVHPVPGPSSLLAALCIAGLPADRVLFAGFLPPKSAARRTALEVLT